MARILVIDDDPLIRLFIHKALQSRGDEVILVCDGQEGLRQAHQLQPALIICDWMMPGIDGLEVCRQVKADPVLSTTFFVLLTARDGIADRVEGLNTGADDFLTKPIDISELRARVQAGLRLYQLNQDLRTQKQRLEAELAEAAAYVQSLLPPPLTGEITIDARFVPSRQLGGDCFDYFWLDPDYLAIYLLDVSGHGLGAALPSSVLLNLLRSQSLPNVNFYQPPDVLQALNETFQMSRQNQKYFTIWYGVYNRVKRQLTYASAGHPPAALVSVTNSVTLLTTPSVPIGMFTDTTYVSDRCSIPADSTLYVFSDGIYELSGSSCPTWGFEPFIALLAQSPPAGTLDALLDRICQLAGTTVFDDDLSLLRIHFR